MSTLRPPFRNTEQTAELLGISVDALYKMVQRGQLPFIRRGKKALLFSEPMLLAFLSSRASSPKGDT